METVSEVIVDHGFELQCCFGRFLMRQSKSVNVEKGNEKDLTSFCLHLSHAERAKKQAVAIMGRFVAWTGQEEHACK